MQSWSTSASIPATVAAGIQAAAVVAPVIPAEQLRIAQNVREKAKAKKGNKTGEVHPKMTDDEHWNFWAPQIPQECNAETCNATNWSWTKWGEDLQGRPVRIVVNVRKLNFYIYTPKVARPNVAWRSFESVAMAWDEAKRRAGMVA